MKDLRAVLEGLGLQNVKTYIQSGNVVFQSRSGDGHRLAHEISAAIGERHPFTPRVLVLSVEELQSAIAANPFPEAEGKPASLHFFFLESHPADPDMAKLEALRVISEKFALVGAVFYLHAPDGIGRSKLAAYVEKALGVVVTVRNGRSVQAIMALAMEVSS